MANDKDISELCRILAVEVAYANTYLHIFKGLNKWRDKSESSSFFWWHARSALLSMSISNLTRVYDKHDASLNLARILKETRSLGGANIDKDTFDRYVSLCGEKPEDELVKALRAWRNGVVAHYNYKVACTPRSQFCSANPLLEKDGNLELLIMRAFEILDWCATCVTGFPAFHRRFAEQEDSYKDVLKRLDSLK